MRSFSASDSMKFSPAWPLTSSPLMPGTDATHEICAANACSSIEKPDFIGTIVAAWTPRRRSLNDRAMTTCFARENHDLMDDLVEERPCPPGCRMIEDVSRSRLFDDFSLVQ